jgi:phosphosulfolactate synthase (CoM biosynthesis protein A)
MLIYLPIRCKLWLIFQVVTLKDGGLNMAKGLGEKADKELKKLENDTKEGLKKIGKDIDKGAKKVIEEADKGIKKLRK